MAFLNVNVDVNIYRVGQMPANIILFCFGFSEFELNLNKTCVWCSLPLPKGSLGGLQYAPMTSGEAVDKVNSVIGTNNWACGF